VGSDLDADARDLLELAAIVLSDRALWTTKVMRARRWRSSPRHEKTKCACSPRDRRATEWTTLGALELVADDPDAPEVVRALDLLLEAARGWTIARVEEEGREWALWTIAVAVTRRPGLTLSPRADAPPPVDRKAAREESTPATQRSRREAA
jgi:hypothetical protein